MSETATALHTESEIDREIKEHLSYLSQEGRREDATVAEITEDGQCVDEVQPTATLIADSAIETPLHAATSDQAGTPAAHAEIEQEAEEGASAPQAPIPDEQIADEQIADAAIEASTSAESLNEAPSAIKEAPQADDIIDGQSAHEEAATDSVSEPSEAVNGTPPSLETITPAVAKEWLAKNTKNRTVSQSTVDRYASQMKAGLWQINGETIKFNIKDKLIDGQHRLHAVIKSEATIQAYVVRGLPPEAFKTLDRGRKRNAADDLGILGEANRTVLSATLNLYYSWQLQNLNGIKNGKGAATSDDLIDILAEHPEIRKAVTRCANSPFRKMVSSSTLAFCYYILSRLDADETEDFFTKLELGTNLDLNDPVYRLREKMTDLKTKRTNITKEETVALIFKAWNSKRQGKPMRSCNWVRETEPFPYPI